MCSHKTNRTDNYVQVPYTNEPFFIWWLVQLKRQFYLSLNPSSYLIRPYIPDKFFCWMIFSLPTSSKDGRSYQFIIRNIALREIQIWKVFSKQPSLKYDMDFVTYSHIQQIRDTDSKYVYKTNLYMSCY